MKAYQFQHEMQSNAKTFGRKGDIQVTFSGDRPFVKDKQINLPAIPLDAELNTNQIRVLRGYVDQEAGRIKHTDTTRVDQFEQKADANNRKPLADINSTLMDQWVGRKVRKEYAGSHYNFEASHNLKMSHLSEHLKEVPDEAVDKFDPAAIPTLLDTGIEDFRSEKSRDGEVGRVFSDNLKEHATKWREELHKCNTTEDVLDLAKSIYKLIQEDPQAQSKPEEFDPKAGQGMDEGEAQGESIEGEGTEEGYADQETHEKFEQANEGRDAESQMTGENQEYQDGKPKTIEDMAEDHTAGGGIGTMVGDLTGGYRVFSTAGDVVYRRAGKTKAGPEANPYSNYQKLVDSKDFAVYNERRNAIKSFVMVMKNKLRRALIAKRNRGWERGREEGVLDDTRLVRAYQGDTQVFKRREEREEHETAIVLLADLSGSMSGMKAETARDVCIALSECFEGTQMKYKIVGFHNSGRPRGSLDNTGKFHRYECTHTIVFKDFSDPLRMTKAAVAQLEQGVGGNNSDYDFVAAELAELSKRDENRKILFVLSDGHPACYSDASMDEHIRCIKKTIQEHERKGVECIGIGIQDDAVKEIYKKNVVVQDVEELATRVFKTLTDTLVK